MNDSLFDITFKISSYLGIPIALYFLILSFNINSSSSIENENVFDISFENQIINNLQSKILDIKKKVIEIRESNRFSVPKYIMSRYPVIFNINIFSFIKTVSDYRNGLINKLKNVINEIKYIGCKKSPNLDDKERIKYLYEEKQDIMNEMIALSSTYNLVDIMFQQEIKNNILFKKYYYLFYTQRIINYFTCSKSTCILK